MNNTVSPMLNRTVGALRVIGYAGSNGRRALWTVRCEAGHRFTATGTNLRKAAAGRWEIRCPECVA